MVILLMCLAVQFQSCISKLLKINFQNYQKLQNNYVFKNWLCTS